MNRRQFIIGSFMAGLLTAVGIKPRDEAKVIRIEEWQENKYFKCHAFSLGTPTTVYFVGQQVTWGDVKVLPGVSGNYASVPFDCPIVMRPAPSC